MMQPLKIIIRKVMYQLGEAWLEWNEVEPVLDMGTPYLTVSLTNTHTYFLILTWYFPIDF